MHKLYKPNFYSGTSGLQVPIPKRDFPQEHQNSSRLAFYSSLFNSLEVNSSFYKLPITKTVAKWAAEVGDDFKFTYKLWRDITHNKGLEFDPENVQRFLSVIDHTGSKKGCLLVQFPPSTKAESLHQLEILLATINLHDADRQWAVAVEFRHKSWYQDNVYEVLEKYAASMVLHDLPASAAPMIEPLADFVYLRFHGPGGGYRGSYDDDILNEYAQYITEWLGDGKTVYAYFNNTMGAALNNLQTLNSFVNNQ